MSDDDVSSRVISHPRELPRVDDMLRHALLADAPRSLARLAVREALDAARRRVLAGETVSLAALGADAAERTRCLVTPSPAPVINATGVVLHTNLGRAPWSAAAVEAASRVARGYCDLEIDLSTGRRGRRVPQLTERLVRLTGAEDALVVNNCAAAVLLALTALAQSREVVVSRGELVEIGGSFRVPDVIASCGAMLVGVGTTNRTRVVDYEHASHEATGAWLAVHPSNFRVTGFVERPDLSALSAAARVRGVPVVYDIGSGSLSGRDDEPGVRASVAAGIDVVAFSGDKLLGGPQSGILVGRRDSIQRLRRHPLYRALRMDKTLLAGLDATLLLHEGGCQTRVDAMLDAPPEVLRARADAFAAQLRADGLDARCEPRDGAVGGGALSQVPLPGFVVSVGVHGLEAATAQLRSQVPPVLCRIKSGRIAVDLRTVAERELPALRQALAGLPNTR